MKVIDLAEEKRAFALRRDVVEAIVAASGGSLEDALNDQRWCQRQFAGYVADFDTPPGHKGLTEEEIYAQFIAKLGEGVGRDAKLFRLALRWKAREAWVNANVVSGYDWIMRALDANIEAGTIKAVARDIHAIASQR